MVISPKEHDPRRPARPFLDHPEVAELKEFYLRHGAEKTLLRAGQDIGPLGQHISTTRKKMAEEAADVYKAGLRLGARLAFLKEAGLLKGDRATTAYVARHCRLKGKALRAVEWRRFVDIFTRLRGEVAALGHASRGRRALGLLGDVAALADEACRGLLEEHLLKPRYTAEAIRRGLKAAKDSAWLPDPEARREVVQAALDGKRVRRRKGPPAEGDLLKKGDQIFTGCQRWIEHAFQVGGALADQARIHLAALNQSAARHDRGPAGQGSGGKEGKDEDGEDGEDEDQGRRKSPRDLGKAANSSLPADAELQPAAPPRLGPQEAALAIPYPADDPGATPCDIHAAAALCALARVNHLQEPIREGRLRGQALDEELLRRGFVVVRDFRPLVKEAAARLQALSDAGHRELTQELEQAGPGTSLEDLLPLPLGRITGQEAFVPMAYLKLDLRDPTALGTLVHSGVEKDLIQVMALIAQGRHHLSALIQRLDQGEPVAPDLIFQLDQVLQENSARLNMIIVLLREEVEKTQESYEARRAEREARRQAAQARLIVAGAETVPPQYTIIGMTPGCHPVAVTQTAGMALLVAGEPGAGKTQTGVNIAEGAVLNPPGLGQMQKASRVVVVTSDLNKGEANHQHLYGVYPNPYPAQWDYLRQWYDIQFGPGYAGYRRIICLVLPGTKWWYEQRYPDLMERGVEFRELRFHPDEQGSLFFRLMVQGGETSGPGRSQKRIFIEDWLANHGVGHPPRKLLDALLKAKLPGVNPVFLNNQFKLIGDLSSRDEHLISVLDEEALVVVLLEGKDFGADRIVPIEVALLSALSQRTADDPHRWFILHELAKRLKMSEELARLLLEAVGEIRHRPLSFLLETHMIGELPPELVQKMSGILQFKCTSRKDFQKLQELCWMFHGVDFDRISQLPRGVCYGAFRLATNGLFMRQAQEINTRPSTVWAKGETQQVA